MVAAPLRAYETCTATHAWTVYDQGDLYMCTLVMLPLCTQTHFIAATHSLQT